MHERRFSTGLFLDYHGGISLGQIVHLCGPAGSGKTILASHLALKFLEEFHGSKVIFFDADKTLNKHDLESLCRSNNIGLGVLGRFKITIPTNWIDILQTIDHEIHEGGMESLIIVDSLPNIFAGEQYELLDRAVSERERISAFVKGLVDFFIRLRKWIEQNSTLLLIIVNQVRSIPPSSEYPEFWLRKGYTPAYWNIINVFIDTCILLEKIRRGLISLRVVFSSDVPEVLGIIRIEDNLKIG